MHIKAYFFNAALLFLSSLSETQAMIIAFTSDMIPRLVYYWSFSVPPYGSHSSHTMKGYINSTLSVFNISDFKNVSKPLSPWFGNQMTCRQVSNKCLSFSNYKNNGFLYLSCLIQLTISHKKH